MFSVTMVINRLSFVVNHSDNNFIITKIPIEPFRETFNTLLHGKLMTIAPNECYTSYFDLCAQLDDLVAD